MQLIAKHFRDVHFGEIYVTKKSLLYKQTKAMLFRYRSL